MSTAHARGSFAAFAALWAIHVLFHVGSYALWRESAAAVVAALFVLARPGSPARALVLAAAVAADAWVHAPRIANHWLIDALLGLALGLAWLDAARRSGGLRVEAAAVYRGFAPALRWSLVAVYAFAALAKLNRDFLFSAESCGVLFYARWRDVLPFLPEGAAFETAAVWAGVAVELALPLLLAWPRWRPAGIALGLAFHFALSLNPISGFFNFSSLALAAYVAFLPPGALAGAFQRLDRWQPLGRGARRRRLGRAGWAAAVLGVAGLALADAGPGVVVWIWLPYGLVAGGTLLASAFAPRAAASREEEEPGAPPVRAAGALAWVVPGLVLLNGLAPYLGLKTEGSFTMYSNLRTEGGETNHLFVPPALQVFGYQRDLVDVPSSSHRDLRRLHRNGELIPFLRLRRLLAERPRAQVTYVRNGERVTLEHAYERPELVAPLPVLQRKLMGFRPVDREGPARCRH